MIDKHALAQTSPKAAAIARLMAMPDEQRFAHLHTGAVKRMAKIDALPLEWRLLVHEFGWHKTRKQRERTRDARKAFIALSLTQVDLDL